jgi:CBS domain-containing protein
VAGKADWFANGFPREGKCTASPQIGDLIRRDVSICRLGDRVDEVLQRVQTTGWDQCIVVNDAGVVLGLLRGEALHAALGAPVELAMEAGPTTIRPNRSLSDIRTYMRQHGVASVVVTTPAGQLMGIVERQDIERCLAPAVQPHEGRYRPQRETIVYLPIADNYCRLTHRLSQGQKGIAERARMASQWPSLPWERPQSRPCGRTAPAQATFPFHFPSPQLVHTPAGCGHGGTRYNSTSRRVHTWSVSPAAIAGVWGCQRLAEPLPWVGSGCGKG